jgi:SpoVK/Ycf46/Vps4 family AAA+-type ATPase
LSADLRTLPEELELPGLLAEHLDASLARVEAVAEGTDPAPAEARVDAAEAYAVAAGVRLPLIDLQERYGLSPLERDLLLLALRPQLRLTTRGQVGSLAELLDLLHLDTLLQLAAQACLDPGMPLRRHRLMDLWSRDPESHAQVLAQQVLAPPRVAAFLTGRIDLGSALSLLASVVHPSPAADWVPSPAAEGLQPLLASWREQQPARPLALALIGEDGSGKSATVRALARRQGTLLFEVDGSYLTALDPRTGVWAVQELFAAAQLFDAWLVFDHAQAWTEGHPTLHALGRCLAEVPVLTFVLATRPVAVETGIGAKLLRQVVLDPPDEPQRGRLWRSALAQLGRSPAEGAVERVAAQFELSPAQIRHAALELRLLPVAGPPTSAARAREETGGEELEPLALGQLRRDPGDLARLPRTALTLDDLVLPPEEQGVLAEILQACRHRYDLLHRWGFRERLGHGTGIVCLFSGEPGTGKTLCAEILAADLGQDLYQVSLPQTVSKWVGETEKQISRIFQQAKAARAILLFDEADSLLSSRTEVKTASDRYANMATNHLLQEIERFDGVILLTTNLEENLDTAAARRILFRLRFPFPDAASRARLWRTLIPKKAKCADDLDFEALGEAFELSGGHIKNAVVRGAYEALSRGRAIDMGCLARAGVQECRATGRLIREELEVVGQNAKPKSRTGNGRRASRPRKPQ